MTSFPAFSCRPISPSPRFVITSATNEPVRSSVKETARFLLTACVIASGASIPASAAAPEGVAIERVEVGIEESAKIGRWTPVAVTVTSAEPRRVRLSLKAPDPDGNVVVHPSDWVALTDPGTRRLHGFFRFGRPDCMLDIEVRGESGRLASRRLHISRTDESAEVRAFRQSVPLVATVGEIRGFSDLNDTPYRVIALEGAERLPRHERGYDGLNAVVIAGPCRLDGRRIRALRNWVRLGGHLVVCVGSRVEEYRNSALGEWISRPAGSRPALVPISGKVQVRDLSGLESFTGTGERIRFRQTPAARIGPMDDFGGLVLASSLDGPILVRSACAFGHITVLALDPNQSPLASWPALPQLARNLIDETDRTGETGSQSERPGRLTHSGISDLASQLHAIQDHFPQVRRVSLWAVMGLLAVYLMLIGPVDYVLVHHVLRRPRLTWLTFPAVVVAAAVLTAWTATALNGEQRRVNQLDLVDIDARSQWSRYRSWITLYSPQARRYRIAVHPRNPKWSGRRGPAASGSTATGAASNGAAGGGSPGPVPWLSWEGLPEESFGGMYRGGGLLVGGAAYRSGAAPNVVEDVPVPLWSTKSFTAAWHTPRAPLVESDLATAGVGGQLTGTLTHRLPAAIEDWILAYGNRVYFPRLRESAASGDELKPGEIWSLEAARRAGRVQQRALSHFLTGTRRVRVDQQEGMGPEIQKQRRAYDALSREPDKFMRMLTFHEASGGAEYTGLSNEVLGSGDLSPLLHLNRAVLLGRIDTAAAEVRLDGEAVDAERHLTYVRILLPVSVGAAPERLPDFDPP